MVIKSKKVAPDGGWGWMVVLAMAINNLITIPIFQNFGLLYRDAFSLKSVNISLQEASIILNTNSAFGYVLGILNGPILRNLGYRKVALAGSVMMFVGLFVTSYANLFIVFFIFYGLINSLGIGWSMASHHLALSTYFVEKRAMAMGMAMAVTGLGPVFMPLVISNLMDSFGARGTTLLLSGIVLNTVCCAMLLQPIKWHRKIHYFSETLEVSREQEVPEASTYRSTLGGSVTAPKVTEAHSKPSEMEIPAEGDVLLFDLDKVTQELTKLKVKPKRLTGAQRKKVLKEAGHKEVVQKNEVEMVDMSEEGLLGSKTVVESKKEKKQCFQILVETFDLDLLKDVAFLSMCVGMSIALAADMNFSLMLPFILGDYNYDIHTTAKVQSVVGVADIVSRLITPFILRKTNISARVSYLCSLFCLIITRFCLTLSSEKYSVMVVVFLFGVSKGVRAVFMPLVIPNYVPLDKLPSAQGLQNVFHGLLLMMLGPLIGYLRDKTGNFILCIHVMNSLTAVTILLWALEFVYMKSQKKNTFQDNADAER